MAHLEGQRERLLCGVHHDQVGGAQGGPVDPSEGALLGRAAELPVADRVGQADEMVQHDRRVPEQGAGQMDIRVPEVADHHHVRIRPLRARLGHQTSPGPQLLAGERRGRPGRPGGGDLVRGRRAQRHVQLLDVPAVGRQPVAQDRDPRMQGRVVRAEEQGATGHDSPSPAST